MRREGHWWTLFHYGYFRCPFFLRVFTTRKKNSTFGGVFARVAMRIRLPWERQRVVRASPLPSILKHPLLYFHHNSIFIPNHHHPTKPSNNPSSLYPPLPHINRRLGGVEKEGQNTPQYIFQKSDCGLHFFTLFVTRGKSHDVWKKKICYPKKEMIFFPKGMGFSPSPRGKKMKTTIRFLNWGVGVLSLLFNSPQTTGGRVGDGREGVLWVGCWWLCVKMGKYGK